MDEKKVCIVCAQRPKGTKQYPAKVRGLCNSHFAAARKLGVIDRFPASNNRVKGSREQEIKDYLERVTT